MPDLMQQNKQMQAPAASLLRGKTAGVIGLIAMLIFALHASTRMVGAGDTWVALACGRHFYNHGVDTNEPFSANSHRQGPTTEEIATWPDWAQTIADKVSINTLKYWHPTGWIDQNWLTHVIFHWLAYKSPFADGPKLVFQYACVLEVCDIHTYHDLRLLYGQGYGRSSRLVRRSRLCRSCS